MKNILVKEKIKNLHLQYAHPSYALERKLLKSIEMGLLDESLIILSQINETERAHLSNNSIRSLKNSLIGSCTLFTRAIISTGISPEDAFDLSDALIMHIEALDNIKELIKFEAEMVKEFVQIVNLFSTKKYRYPISKVVTYIHEHVSTKLTVSDLSKMVYVSPDYLPKLFKKEVGISISKFIKIQKIDVAKDLLENSEMKITDIATLLAYCNHGYFTNIFKEVVGQSPIEYRKNFRK